MSAKTGALLFGVLFFLVVGTAQAQYGIGRYEQMQVMAEDLKQATRHMYLIAERQFPQFRNDSYVLNRLYRLRQEAANFEHQVERNSDDQDALRRAYQRMYSAWFDAEYTMRRMHGFGFLNREFEMISIIVHRLSPGRGYTGGYYDDDRYGYENDEFEREYDSDEEYEDDDDDDDEEYDEFEPEEEDDDR